MVVIHQIHQRSPLQIICAIIIVVHNYVPYVIYLKIIIAHYKGSDREIWCSCKAFLFHEIVYTHILYAKYYENVVMLQYFGWHTSDLCKNSLHVWAIMRTYTYVCVCVCVCTCMCLYVYICVCLVCVYINRHACVCMYVCVSLP